MPTTRRLTTPALTSLFTLMAVASAHATTVLKVDVETMTATSEWVVEARVTDVRYADLRGEGAGLFTDVTLTIDQVYKGEAVPARYVLRLVGGVGDDGMALTVPGMPRFRRGERVILFLEKTTTGHVPCGLGQGVWRVVDDTRGQPWVQQSSHGLHMMRRSPTGRLVGAEHAALTDAKTLESLIAEVYAALLAPPLQSNP